MSLKKAFSKTKQNRFAKKKSLKESFLKSRNQKHGKRKVLFEVLDFSCGSKSIDGNSIPLLLLHVHLLEVSISVLLMIHADSLATYPLQSYLFAHLVDVFTLTGQQLVTKGNFWSLMFFILACAVGIAYWVMGWTFHLISHVRKEIVYLQPGINLGRLFLRIIDKSIWKMSWTRKSSSSMAKDALQEHLHLNFPPMQHNFKSFSELIWVLQVHQSSIWLVVLLYLSILA